jgi:hypothetical protein
MQTVTVFTTAPKSYDYGYTVEVEANAGRTVVGFDLDTGETKLGKQVYRRVEIPLGMLSTQCDRYRSGLVYGIQTCTEFAKLIDAGVVVTR